jgi:CheY-like chemotaxis protein
MAVILLVEGDDQVRLLAQSYLEEHGHTVLTAARSQDASVVLNGDQPIDLLLTDIELEQNPDAGLELAQRALMIRPDIKVLYATGKAITDGMKARFVEGAAVLQKPYTTEQLSHALSAHFSFNPKPG